MAASNQIPDKQLTGSMCCLAVRLPRIPGTKDAPAAMSAFTGARRKTIDFN
jgi:hypothetical protein